LSVSLVCWQEELQDVKLWVAIDLTVSQLCTFLPSWHFWLAVVSLWLPVWRLRPSGMWRHELW